MRRSKKQHIRSWNCIPVTKMGWEAQRWKHYVIIDTAASNVTIDASRRNFTYLTEDTYEHDKRTGYKIKIIKVRRNESKLFEAYMHDYAKIMEKHQGDMHESEHRRQTAKRYLSGMSDMQDLFGGAYQVADV